MITGETFALEGRALALYRLDTLDRAVRDLAAAHGAEYGRAVDFLDRSRQLRERLAAEGPAEAGVEAEVSALQREALLANPVLRSRSILLVKRRPAARRGTPGLEIGMPSNHECNSSLARTGYDNELCILKVMGSSGSPAVAGSRVGSERAAQPSGDREGALGPLEPLQTLYRPAHGGYVGEMDLHWEGDRLLFTQSDGENWKIFEIRADGSGLRAVSRMPADVDSFDGCYLPDGGVIFGSTASYQSVPCWHGQRRVSNLYRMDGEGRVRQLCFDQDHNFHPVVLPNGQVLYHRWDYTGINHIYLRELMLMNPDGVGQRAIYGSGSWYPNALYFPQPLPGEAGGVVSILSGYHGVHRMGQLVVLDTTRGWHEAEGMVGRISGRGEPIRRLVKDELVDGDWPKFLHPFPISAKHFLVAAWLEPRGNWGIYLADVFDNLVLVREEPGWALLEPVLLQARRRPPILPDQVDLGREEGVVYLHDVHAGPGLAGVPRGTVKRLRVLAYHFGYPGLAGPDRIGYGGPWEVMRILGTVPLEADGSAVFRVPASTPIAVQPLDEAGQAVQLMRSWFTVMPGESASCVGCHERPAETPPAQLALAGRRVPRELDPWRGPARGFDFEREVQPVLDRHCVRCHDGSGAAPPGESGVVAPGCEEGVIRAAPDLRARCAVRDYAGRRISQMGIDRLHPRMRSETRGMLKYAPAYDALIPYLRRVGIEDDVSMLTAGEYHVDTSPLVQMLRKGHHGVVLDEESWDRLATWIDLNAPCHGTWGEVYPVPDGAHERRQALRRVFGGPREDPEEVPRIEPRTQKEAKAEVRPALVGEVAAPTEPEGSLLISEWPSGARERRIGLGEGNELRLVLIPAGEFAMGDAAGAGDERPVARVKIARPFWMAACEISNEQFRQFDPNHDSRYYQKRYPPLTPGAASYVGPDARGLTLNGDPQPAVRVSWEQAMAYCRWLAERTGLEFTLPTEAQWEWACRAGTGTAFNFGDCDADYSGWANLADVAFSRGLGRGGKQVTGGLEHLVLEGAGLSDTRYRDGAVVTTGVGGFRANAWGLHDLHGNAAEWTRTMYAPYPYRAEDGRNDASAEGRKVVRGGSFFDPPARSRSASRLAYPAWRRVFNVGFRVVAE